MRKSSGKVYDIKTGGRKVSVQEFEDLLNAVELLIQELRSIRKDQAALNNAVNIVQELRTCGASNKAREAAIVSLEALIDEMYAEINGG